MNIFRIAGELQSYAKRTWHPAQPGQGGIQTRQDANMSRSRPGTPGLYLDITAEDEGLQRGSMTFLDRIRDTQLTFYRAAPGSPSSLR